MSTAAVSPAFPIAPRILLIQAHTAGFRNLPEVAALLARAAVMGFTVKATSQSPGFGSNDMMWTLQADQGISIAAHLAELKSMAQIGSKEQIRVFVA